MPTSRIRLFQSYYAHVQNLEVGDTCKARIKSKNNQQWYCRIVEIEETIEDGETVYIYWGVLIRPV